MSFFSDHCNFYDTDSKTLLATGKLIDGLYHLEFQPLIVSASFNPSSCTQSSINIIQSKSQLSVLWNLRLGHVSNEVLHKIPEVHTSIIDSCNKQCPDCPLSKQTKLPFQLSESRVEAIFGLIHIDLWGSYAS